MKSSPEAPRYLLVPAVATVMALGITGCSSSANNELQPTAYECGQLEDWTVQSQQGISEILYSSGALDKAAEYGQDAKLARSIAHEIYMTKKDLPENFQASVVGNIQPEDVVVQETEQILIPTECLPSED